MKSRRKLEKAREIALKKQEDYDKKMEFLYKNLGFIADHKKVFKNLLASPEGNRFVEEKMKMTVGVVESIEEIMAHWDKCRDKNCVTCKRVRNVDSEGNELEKGEHEMLPVNKIGFPKLEGPSRGPLTVGQQRQNAVGPDFKDPREETKEVSSISGLREILESIKECSVEELKTESSLLQE